MQKEAQRQKEMAKQAAEEARQKNASLKWAGQKSQPQVTTSTQPVKSLLEIQAEEEKELKKVIFINKK